MLLSRDQYSGIQNIGRACIVLYLMAVITYMASGTEWYFLSPDELVWIICMFVGVALVSIHRSRRASVHATKLHVTRLIVMLVLVYDIIVLWTQATVVYQCRQLNPELMSMVRKAKASGVTRGDSRLYPLDIMSYRGLECAGVISDNYYVVEVFQIIYLVFAVLLAAAAVVVLHRMSTHNEATDVAATHDDPLSKAYTKNRPLSIGVVFLLVSYTIVYLVSVNADATTAKAVGIPCFISLISLFVAVYTSPANGAREPQADTPDYIHVTTHDAATLIALAVGVNNIYVSAIAIDKCANLPQMLDSLAVITNMNPIQMVTAGAADEYFVSTRGYETCYNWRMGNTLGTWLIACTMFISVLVAVISVLMMYGKRLLYSSKKVS